MVPLGSDRRSGSRVRFPVSTTRLMFTVATAPPHRLLGLWPGWVALSHKQFRAHRPPTRRPRSGPRAMVLTDPYANVRSQFGSEPCPGVRHTSVGAWLLNGPLNANWMTRIEV